MEEKKAVSLGLTFESLCRFFSNKDASGLLGLPNAVTEASSSDYRHVVLSSICRLLIVVLQSLKIQLSWDSESFVQA